MLLIDGVQCSEPGYNLPSEQHLLHSEHCSPTMGTKGAKHRPEPVEGLEEDSCLSVIPIYRTSIRVSLDNYLYFIPTSTRHKSCLSVVPL